MASIAKSPPRSKRRFLDEPFLTERLACAKAHKHLRALATCATLPPGCVTTRRRWP